jgi:hypothetical protein
MIRPLLLLFVLFSFACDENNETDFTASLTGAEEVPAVTTSATGTARFTHDENDQSIQFTLNVNNISSAFAAHIHEGATGVNGDVVVTLFDGPVTSGSFSGTLSSGPIRSGDVSGMSFDQLVGIMRSGQAYVNVHTTQNPGGEIRGQIAVLD